MDQQSDQPTDGSAQLLKLSDWLQLLASQDRFYFRDGVAVQIHGDGDDSFAVIERDVSAVPLAVDQYHLHARGSRIPLWSLFQFLAEYGFDIDRVLARVGDAEFPAPDYAAQISGLEVIHRRVTEVQG